MRSRCGASARAICCPRAGCSPPRSWRCSKTTSGSTMRGPRTRRRRRSPQAAGERLVYPVEANEIFVRATPGGSGGASRAGLRFLRLGPGRNPAGHELGPERRAGRSACGGDRRPVSAEALDLQRSHASLHHLHGDLGFDLDRDPRPARHRSAAMVGRLPLRHRRHRHGAGREVERRKPEARRQGPCCRRLPRVRAVLHQLQRGLSGRTAHHVGRSRDRLRAAVDPEHP